jgi:hypothetical protein
MARANHLHFFTRNVPSNGGKNTFLIGKRLLELGKIGFPAQNFIKMLTGFDASATTVCTIAEIEKTMNCVLVSVVDDAQVISERPLRKRAPKNQEQKQTYEK